MNPLNHASLFRSPLRAWTAAALMAAAVVFLSPLFSVPLGVSRAFPLQHMMNIFLSVLLGTRYSVGAAFTSSLLRNLMGSGTILAFPGSMIGAFLSGILYKHTRSIWAAAAGEFVGTSLIGGLVSYPIASWVLNSSAGAFFYVSVFSVSCGAGTVIAVFLLKTVPALSRLFQHESR